MRLFKGTNDLIYLTLSSNELDEVGAVIRVLTAYNEACQVALGIKGGPNGDLDQLQNDAPFVEQLLKEMIQLNPT